MHSFKDVQIPVENSYVKPGFYKMAPTKAELIEKEGKTPYLNITFEGNKGKLSDKFYLSEKAIARLQYLHVGLYDKRLEKDFNSDKDLATYFNTLFEKKSITVNLVVGGEESNGKTYASLPYTGFIMSEDEPFEEGPFEPGTARYNQVVKRNTGPVGNSVITTSAADDKMPWD